MSISLSVLLYRIFLFFFYFRSPSFITLFLPIFAPKNFYFHLDTVIHSCLKWNFRYSRFQQHSYHQYYQLPSTDIFKFPSFSQGQLFRHILMFGSCSLGLILSVHIYAPTLLLHLLVCMKFLDSSVTSPLPILPHLNVKLHI